MDFSRREFVKSALAAATLPLWIKEALSEPLSKRAKRSIELSERSKLRLELLHEFFLNEYGLEIDIPTNEEVAEMLRRFNIRNRYHLLEGKEDIIIEKAVNIFFDLVTRFPGWNPFMHGKKISLFKIIWDGLGEELHGDALYPLKRAGINISDKKLNDVPELERTFIHEIGHLYNENANPRPEAYFKEKIYGNTDWKEIIKNAIDKHDRFAPSGFFSVPALKSLNEDFAWTLEYTLGIRRETLEMLTNNDPIRRKKIEIMRLIVEQALGVDATFWDDWYARKTNYAYWTQKGRNKWGTLYNQILNLK